MTEQPQDALVIGISGTASAEVIPGPETLARMEAERAKDEE